MSFDPWSYTLAKEALKRNLTESTKSVITVPHTYWANGLTNEEVYRLQLNPNKSFKFIRGELQLKGGGSLSTLVLDIYDATNASTLTTITAGSIVDTEITSAPGATILIRITNSSGSDQVACFNILYEIV